MRRPQRPRMRGVCTFTFDDGPNPAWTTNVLAELDRCGVKATFFMIGERVDCAPELARAVLEEGHDVELHCDRHIRHSELTDRELADDAEAGLMAFARAGLPKPRRWRPPWGVRTPATDRVAAEHELELVHWTVDTHDWRGDTSEEMLAAVGGGIEAGAVVLMHDGLGPGARRQGAGETVGLIAPLCVLARGRDLRIVSLSQAAAVAPGEGSGTPG
jgi:peptidoglycan/xylan/chitin deacetylase (PgdA/CDA1 family)